MIDWYAAQTLLKRQKQFINMRNRFLFIIIAVMTCMASQAI